MSKSVVVNFGANALWQLHRFLQLCLRRFGRGGGWGGWLNYQRLTVLTQPSEVI